MSSAASFVLSWSAERQNSLSLVDVAAGSDDRWLVRSSVSSAFTLAWPLTGPTAWPLLLTFFLLVLRRRETTALKPVRDYNWLKVVTIIVVFLTIVFRCSAICVNPAGVWRRTDRLSRSRLVQFCVYVKENIANVSGFVIFFLIGKIFSWTLEMIVKSGA